MLLLSEPEDCMLTDTQSGNRDRPRWKILKSQSLQVQSVIYLHVSASVILLPL